MHFTLKFLGATEESRVEAAAQVVRDAAVAGAAELTLEGLGGFPKTSHAHVAWIGVTAGSEAMVRLAASVDSACAAAGFAREERPFTPHLTIARLGRNARASRLPEVKTPVWHSRMREVVLFRSEQSSSGSVYVPMERAVATLD